MGRAGREFVQQFHNIDREINILEDTYRTVV